VNAPVLLVRFRSEPGQAAVLLDIDGTLAPIVERPEDAEVPPPTRAEVERLAGRYRLVACVSGRPSAEARRLVGLDQLEYVGVHGLENDPEARRFAPELERFLAEAAWPWHVENKGGVTLAFHHRQAEDEEDAAARVDELANAAEEAGLTAHRGRKVLEVRPPVPIDKGIAVRRLLAGRPISRALYAGDDTTDLDAFRGLDESDLETVVKVGVGSAEMNPRMLNASDFVVDGPAGLLEFLRQL
jgi:trehalose 6-phosphate phosphatase